MDKVYKNTSYLNSMGIDLKNLSSASLDELEQLREIIDDRINIIKEKTSLKSEKEADEYLTNEELILAKRLDKVSEKKELYHSLKDVENLMKKKKDEKIQD